MKRSHSIALVLLSGASAGTFSGCSDLQGARPVRISSQCVYPNSYYVRGVGYYHAPFYVFYPYPYNYYDASRRRYFAGGMWLIHPFESEINLSSPTDLTAARAEVARTDVVRGGFGGFASGHSIWS